MPLRLPLFLAPLLMFGYIFMEIAAFIFVGSRIGILSTLCLVLLSSALGFWLLRGFGRGFARQMRQDMQAMEQGGRPDIAEIGRLSRRLFTCFGAVLLIIPGFVSSVIGLILLIPPVQAALVGYARKKGRLRAKFSYRSGDSKKAAQQGEIIDLEPENYHARDPESSPWRKP